MTHAKVYETIRQQKALYGRSSKARINELIEAADALSAKLQTLRQTPTPDGAELIACQADGMKLAACQLSVVLSEEGRS